MSHRATLLGSLVLIAATAACSGVSKERVDTLEAQVKKLEAQSAKPAAGANANGRLATLESSNKKLTAQVTKMGQVLDRLQKQVSAQNKQAPAGNSAVWATVDHVLGVEADGVKSAGNTYTVHVGWLLSQLQILASSRGPRLISNKKLGGIIIRGVRPKSLPEQLGLHNNDVITTINGKVVATPEDVAAALRASGATTTLTFKRHRKQTTLTYKLVD